MEKKLLLFFSSMFYGYVLSCFINPSLLYLTFIRVFLAFPALFILPGILIISLRRHTLNETYLELLVNSFFVSTLLITILTLFFYSFGLSLSPKTYAIVYFLLFTPLIFVAAIRNEVISLSRDEVRILKLVAIAYATLFFIFALLPRFFTPDETLYLYNANVFVIENVFLPVITSPHESLLQLLLSGRIFWILLLSSFIASTGIPPYYGGLFNVYYLIALSLIPTFLISKEKTKLLLCAVLLILTSPTVLIFAGSSLNDLAIAFYISLSVAYFVKSFRYLDNKRIDISIKKIVLSLIPLLIAVSIKPNILVFGGIWLTLVYVMLRYKIYLYDLKHKIFFFMSFLTVVLYEVFIDIPYVIAVWFLRNLTIGDTLRKFLIISFAERITSIFIAPWWDPTRKTMFSLSPLDWLLRFYYLLAPESYTLLISSLILVLPVLLAVKKDYLNIRESVLSLIVIFSFWSFFIFSYNFFSDIPRYSLWMVPLWISMGLIILEKLLVKETGDVTTWKLLFGSSVFVISLNLLLQYFEAGVAIGYGLPRKLVTYPFLFLQIIVLFLYFCSLTNYNKSRYCIITHQYLNRIIKPLRTRIKRPVKLTSKKLLLMLLIVLFSTNIYFSAYFIRYNTLYSNHGLYDLSRTVNQLTSNKEGSAPLIFTNNYIYLRPYLPLDNVNSNRILTFPDAQSEIRTVFERMPTGTKFVVSNDTDTSWYGYGDWYLNQFANSDIIPPPYRIPKALKIQKLTNLVLNMPFDDANATYIPDHSGCSNNGLNHGAKVVNGYYGKAISFNGSSYIVVPHSKSLLFNQSITISFLAYFENTSFNKLSLIVSKGNASFDGTFSIFLSNSDLLFYVGNVGGIRFSISPYIEAWHYFVFSYDGSRMSAFVDGYPVAQDYYSGKIRNSFYNLVIGGPTFGKSEYFRGVIDELQISTGKINSTKLVETYYNAFALKSQEILLQGNREAKIYTLLRNENTTERAPSYTLTAGNVLSINYWIDDNMNLHLEIKILSQEQKNLTILIATDRFTKVRQIFVSSGLNEISLLFPYLEENTSTVNKYWSQLAVINIFLVSDKEIIFQKNDYSFISFHRVLMYFLAILLLSLAVYLVAVCNLDISMKNLLNAIYKKLIQNKFRNHKK